MKSTYEKSDLQLALCDRSTKESDGCESEACGTSFKLPGNYWLAFDVTRPQYVYKYYFNWRLYFLAAHDTYVMPPTIILEGKFVHD